MESYRQTLLLYPLFAFTLALFCRGLCLINGVFGRLMALFCAVLALLALGMVSSTAIIGGSVAFSLVCLVGGLALAQDLKKKNFQFSTDLKWSFALFLAASAYWLWILKDTASLPSRDDGTYHLFYFTRMLQTGEVFTGKTPFLFSELFGAKAQSFYPTGSHYLAAVTTAPLRWIFGVSSFLQLKLFLMFLLSSFPVFLYLGCRKHFERWDRLAVLIGAVLAMTLSVFPFAPLGEGGFSRVTGLICALPVLWYFLDEREPFQNQIQLAALAFPILFFIHPSSIFLPLAAIGVNFATCTAFRSLRWKDWMLYLGCTLFSALSILAILRTGHQIVTSAELLTYPKELTTPNAHSIFDRLKGPFHYYFADGFGVGKFLSVRSLLAYFGVYILFRNERSLRWSWLALFLLPFLLAALVFVPLTPAKMLSVLFYHAVRRMVEPAFFALFVAWVVGFDFLLRQLGPNPSRKTSLTAAACLIALGVTGAGLKKGTRFLREMDTTYQTPRSSDVSDILRTTQAYNPAPVKVVCKDMRSQIIHSMDPTRHHFQWITLTLECNRENLGSEPCQNRKREIERIEKLAVASHNSAQEIRLPWETCYAEFPLKFASRKTASP